MLNETQYQAQTTEVTSSHAHEERTRRTTQWAVQVESYEEMFNAEPVTRASCRRR